MFIYFVMVKLSFLFTCHTFAIFFINFVTYVIMYNTHLRYLSTYMIQINTCKVTFRLYNFRLGHKNLSWSGQKCFSALEFIVPDSYLNNNLGNSIFQCFIESKYRLVFYLLDF